ncbi:hypothetical protein HJC23_005915 [Cyclotella cryptica]|uniref:Mitochondrial import inner membrane translocase subunit TIM50 n=1 Tax=Cyclotella cryptica TaxID=29204 RepID=A0ABD3R218_9STRA|eukprot:CCRYP_000477-RA/>CCRYP_000477-RA protein AED:0.02 eAED:0.02 QI:177/1/1/1/1/1/2/1108/443
MFSMTSRTSLRLAGLVINSSKSPHPSRNMSTVNATRQAVSKEERALRRAARKERANAYLSSIGSGGAAVEGSAAAGSTAATSGSGLPFDATRLGWYAAVVIPTAFIAWGVYDEDSPPAKLSRYVGLADRFEEFSKPARTKLLPDWNQIPNIPPDFPAPPTLVLDLENTLVCSTWDRKYGWRFAKRPGVDKFLSTLAQYYEIVIFTPSPEGLAIPVLDSLDSKGYVMHRLHREATHYHNGVHCKDLSWLNRPMRKIVVLDDDPAALQFQPENLIRVKPYDNPSDREDNTLERITPLLVEISREGYEDIPGLLRQFHGMDADEIADEFERRVADVRIRRDQITQRGLGGFASGRDLPPPELPPNISGGLGAGAAGQQTQLTAKDLVGSAPPSESSESGVIGWLQRRQKQQEEHNKEKFGLWNEVMMKKQAEKKKRLEEQQQQHST